VVIAVDSTFNAHTPEVVQIRANTFEPSKIAPVLRLIAANTVEHALLCVSPIAPNKLYACVQAMKALRDSAGVVDPAYEAAIGNTAYKVGEWIGRKCEGELKVPAMPELPLFVEPSSQTQPTSEEVQMMEINEKRKRQVSGFLPPTSMCFFTNMGAGFSSGTTGRHGCGSEEEKGFGGNPDFF
jgi:hypothetical protein